MLGSETNGVILLLLKIQHFLLMNYGKISSYIFSERILIVLKQYFPRQHVCLKVSSMFGSELGAYLSPLIKKMGY